MAFKLTIKKPDNSVYWVEHFQFEESAQKWIEEEQTRPYWNQEYTYEIEEYNVVLPPTEEEIAAELAKKQAKIDAMIQIKTARAVLVEAKNATTAAEIKAALVKLSRVVLNITKVFELNNPTEAE